MDWHWKSNKSKIKQIWSHAPCNNKDIKYIHVPLNKRNSCYQKYVTQIRTLIYNWYVLLGKCILSSLVKNLVHFRFMWSNSQMSFQTEYWYSYGKYV